MAEDSATLTSKQVFASAFSVRGTSLAIRKFLWILTAFVFFSGVTALASLAGDVNGDGKADILWRNASTGQNAIWLMNGATMVTGQLLTTVSDPNWQIVGVADFNGDGKADILWRNIGTGQNAVWLMNGASIVSGQFLTTISDPNWQIVGVGDFNGDGKADILWRNFSTGQNAIWLMNGASIINGQYLATISDSNWQIVGVADFNGDGKADILWRNIGTGQNAVWLMNGASIVSGQFLTTISDLNWQIPQLAPSGPDFALTLAPVSIVTLVGTTSPAATISVETFHSFSGSVSVDVSGLPAGVTASVPFPLTITAGGSQQITFTVAANAQPGNWPLTLHATSGSLSHYATLILMIGPVISTSQSGSVLYLQSTFGNDTARIGVETKWGGSIIEVSLNGANYVNHYDVGREVQPAMYDGSAHYDDCAGCSGNWGWDPVLGGDRYAHGSPLLNQVLGATSIYTKAQPLQWLPDNKGGGPTTPVPSDMYFEQTITTVPGAPLGFKVHYKLTHFGADQHYNTAQEFPAVYVNLGFDTFVLYEGTAPWTSGTVIKTAAPPPPGTGFLYTPEQWAAYVDSNDMGLTVFAPQQYPYTTGVDLPGTPGETGFGTNYFKPFTVLTFGPGQVIEGDIYLFPGDYKAARSSIYALHQSLPLVDEFTPFGNTDLPAPNATVSGTTQVAGWAFDNVAVSKVEVLVDGSLAGQASYGSPRPDVANVFPNAPLNIGFNLSLNTTAFSNGTHQVTVRVTDTSNNVALYPPVTVTVSN